MNRFLQAPGGCPWLLSLLPRKHLTGISGRRQLGHGLLQEAFSGALSGPESGGAEPPPPRRLRAPDLRGLGLTRLLSLLRNARGRASGSGGFVLEALLRGGFAPGVH